MTCLIPDPPPAPEPRWSGSGYLELEAEGLPGAVEVRISTYTDEGVTLQPIKLPVGTVIASGEAEHTVAGTPDDELVVPVDEQLAKAPWESFKDPYGKVDWPITFTVTTPPGSEPLTATTRTSPETPAVPSRSSLEAAATKGRPSRQ